MNRNQKSGTCLDLRIPLIALMLLLGTGLALLAAPVPAAKTLTVGEFAVLIAARANQGDAAYAPVTPETAVASLQKAGIRMRSDLSSPLTEGDAMDVFRQFGISLQAGSPERLLERDRAASLIGIFGGNLASVAARSDMSFLGRVTKSALAAPTGEQTLPADCQELSPLPNCRTQEECNPCMYCCNKELGLTGKVCGHLCQKKNLVVSPSEPTP